MQSSKIGARILLFTCISMILLSGEGQAAWNSIQLDTGNGNWVVPRNLRTETIEVYHTVKQGETLSSIARKYNVTITEIADQNGIQNPNHLEAGTELVIKRKAGEFEESMRLLLTDGEPMGGDPVVELNFDWPLNGNITSPYGWRKTGFHRGVDIAAPEGTVIKAADDGTVLESGYRGKYGNTVIIRHNAEIQTLYAHASQLLVTKGEAVQQGEPIAKIGSTGRSTGPHLHFEIIVDGERQDPQEYLP